MRLVYLSPVPLASFAQRPHHFARWFHDRFKAQVLWIDPYPARLPRAQDARRLLRRAGDVLGPRWRDEAWIERLHVPSFPFEPLMAGRWLNRLLWADALERIDNFVTEKAWLVAGKPCALALTLSRRHPQLPLLFDVMDNVPAFADGLSRRWLSQAEAMLANESDLIFTASTALQKKFESHQNKVHLVRNGLTLPFGTDAAGLRPSAERPLVFGYVGSIADWFDWNAVDALAARYPNGTIRLIGPCAWVPRRLRPNIELRPAIPQHRVYETMRDFSVGLIPFKVNDLTNYVDPVKYYEYRALGLPVLSTRFGEMRLRDAADRVLFFDALDDAPDWTELRTAAAKHDEIMEFRRLNSWAQRFNTLEVFQDPDRALVAQGSQEDCSASRGAP